jgi:TubC N-terminal docking domain
MNPARLLAELRDAGAILRVHGERLAVEAPTGVITAEIREKLARQKAGLVSLLRISAEPQIDQAIEAFRDLAKLLAVAYRRYSNAQSVLVDRTPESPSGGVALSDESSVHGGGRQDP